MAADLVESSFVGELIQGRALAQVARGFSASTMLYCKVRGPMPMVQYCQWTSFNSLFSRLLVAQLP